MFLDDFFEIQKITFLEKGSIWKGWQSSKNISPMIHDPLFSTEFLKIFQLHSWPQISRLERLLWTVRELVDGETTRRSLACGCFLAFPPGVYLHKKKRGCQTCPRKTKRGKRVSVGDNEDLGGLILLPLIFLGMIFGHFRQSHWPPAGPQRLGENHIGFVVQCRIGNHKKTPASL